MKLRKIAVWSCAATISGVASTSVDLLNNSKLYAQESEPTIIYLVDPEDAKSDEGDLDPTDLGTSTPEPESKAKTAQERLDELIAKIRKEHSQYSDKHKRIATQIEKDQRAFIGSLSDFLHAPFNKKDEEAEPEFNQIRDQIGNLLFKAPTERDYYDRLYLINQVWLENRDQEARFKALDKYLVNKSLEIQERNREIRQWIVGAGAVVGLGLGGYLSYHASSKIFPVVANESGLIGIAKVAGRATVIIVGAGVGASAGAYLGFLGSDALFSYQREFLDPIDGDFDLREILDYRAELDR